MAQEAQDRPVTNKLLATVLALNEADEKKVIKTRNRRTKIKPEYVGHTFAVFNGQGYSNVHITSEMVGRQLGKVSPRHLPTATAKFLSIPPRKMRQVADLIKGQPVAKALNILNFTPKIAAHHMAQVLQAAVANKLSLEGTAALNPEDLRVSQICVDPGPTAKRIQFQSMGRVYRIRKRYCHLAIYLDTVAGVDVQSLAGKVAAKGSAAPKKDTKKKAKSAKSGTATKKTAPKKVGKVADKKSAKTQATGQKGSQRGR